MTPRLSALALAFAALATSSQAQAPGDAAKGEAAFKIRCAMCHAVEPGVNKPMGPTLSGVLGRKAGSAAFKYSPAMAASGVVWNAETLDAYLTAPTKLVPGASMIMAVPNPKDRADLIAYLEGR